MGGSVRGAAAAAVGGGVRAGSRWVCLQPCFRAAAFGPAGTSELVLPIRLLLDLPPRCVVWFLSPPPR
jgi:hypothetical protein